MKNVRQIWEETSKTLQKVYDRREAENMAFILLEDQFAVTRAEVLLAEVKALDVEVLYSSLQRLLNYEPIQYVTGACDFYGRKFQLKSGALIPRPETEELVALILRENVDEQPSILDVGVGSGCIAITLALETHGRVIGTDVSKDALQVARLNADKLNAPIEWLQHDVINEALDLKDLDILVSNPPYIPVKEKMSMHANVLRFEPEIALFVPDDDLLIFYQRIANEGVHALKAGGKIYFEIHESYGHEVADLLRSLGYADITIHQDMQGKDRMVRATNLASR